MDESKLFTATLKKTNKSYYFQDVCKLFEKNLVQKFFIPQLSYHDEQDVRNLADGTFIVFLADADFTNIEIVFRALEVDN